jgi:uncharacterized protein YaiE (UPF0345 family)
MSSTVRKRDVLGWTMAVLSLALLVRLVAFGPVTVSTAPTDTVGGELRANLESSSVSFSIDGNTAEPISPGVMAPLNLKFTNPNAAPMSVTNLAVRVLRVSAPKADDAHPCSVADFVVDQATGLKIHVAPRATNTLGSLGLARAKWPKVGLLNTTANQDGCKGATLRLAYTASGTLEK